MADSNTFGDLYEYATTNGIVMPQTSTVKAQIENCFKNIFGADFSVESSTPQGRLIEALTLLFVNVLGVCAQNANCLNPRQALGSHLDNLGELFGIKRLSDNESDAAFRLRLLESQSAGSGYALAIRRAIAAINTDEEKYITSICVLDNGYPDPAMLPNNQHGVPVDGHSVWIGVGYSAALFEEGSEDDLREMDNQVRAAINSSISAGCGMTPGAKVGVEVTDTWTDDDTGTEKSITFYRQSQIEITIAVTVRDDVYTGDDIVGDTQSAVVEWVNAHATNYFITPSDIASAIAADGKGLVCSAAEITRESVPLTAGVAINPYEYVNISAEDVSVEVI